jgi:hypothetical protein
MPAVSAFSWVCWDSSGDDTVFFRVCLLPIGDWR